MASSSSSGPDTIINLKVSFDGVVKKVKLPLRDLAASTLANKLHETLSLHPDNTYLIERYSDSAASYVVLDPAYPAVFKQLYRAAKAKQKLKLRITTLNKDTVAEKKDELSPPPRNARSVTVEDVPEAVPQPTATTSAPKPAEVMASSIEKTVCDYKAFMSGQGERITVSEPYLDPLEALARKINSVALSSETTQIKTAEIPTVEKKTTPPPPPKPTALSQLSHSRMPFAVYCNSCDKTIPDVHYHCSTCDEGDFDLCQACIDMGISCHGEGHWLIKRMIRDGAIVTSTTSRQAPKPPTESNKSAPRCAKTPLSQAVQTCPAMPAARKVSKCPATATATAVATHPAPRVVPLFRNYLYQNARTCNNCVQEFPEAEFLHCTTCADFDLCKPCFIKDAHGHHPRHGFIPAVEGTATDSEVSCRLAPGRNEKHNAICDGCDKYINGIRHKCLDCPDWDYCSGCVVNAGFVHPNHRFVPIYEPLRDVTARTANLPVHFGIHCDGPLCQAGTPRFIVGDRYKCAVCHDTDFCERCEASPASTHNKTHPLIKFKTPVRNVNVTTTGEHENGTKLPQMGDRPRPTSQPAEPKFTRPTIAPSTVRTVVNVQPAPAPAPSTISIPPQVQKTPTPPVSQPQPALRPSEYCAVYESDTIADGTVMEPNHIFEQTWVLRNAGRHPWPAGCRLKYIGGDYMGHVDSKRPAAVPELISASESTVCYAPLAPGQSFSFTVLLRTPPRDGKVISYWRLTTPEGLKFGHRLWCDVEVKTPAPVKEAPPAVKEEPKEVKAEEPIKEEKKLEGSQMIFPKLEKESPVASIHQDSSAATQSAPSEVDNHADDFEDCNDDEWSEEGFMTDEEYDILDASDEEFVDEKSNKK
ncbi:hypothetical protein MCOR27_002476 [Pyricularia oryzae]|uniref:ZZ-type domain-containing protein n=2 Tax=Pyricularia TaxID=48558 RepID=A0ABQ8N2M9_PYRGI|nr:hypothetical protein MCOR01_007069 [Pyricularia oryzae]KAI6290198.1 hypothetical protein MCOR33_011448 [Pyricularia grisea]KAH9434355.1 hypothetical protein MCOR02_006367 [Pyricularia oryzae]KAI6257004.1 hypothetical protein MCOR19_006583 [Pyricularia oryzae]KAI6277730.1 hypothetical protein MCOR26_005016 [Pyricularia oryzae]